MKLIIMGQQAFGKDCLEKLVASEDDVVAVYCEPDRDGKPVDPIKEYALSWVCRLSNLPISTIRRRSTHWQAIMPI
jgi:methionyl-tRNA formyltransferase